MEKYAAVILAAGKGTRMNEGQESPIPKVMFEILGKPIIKYSVDLIITAGIEKVVLVVGYKQEMVRKYMGSEVEYAVQEEQLGTGHAAQMAESVLKGKAENIIVFYGDNPLFKPESIRKLLDLYTTATYEVAESKVVIGMLTVIFEDPMFWGFGRITRDENGDVSGIVEQKDCTEEQLKIKECNPGFYIFKADWFWENAKKIKSENSQKEYYLTDMIAIAKEQGKKIIATPVSEESEAHGINTPEQLKKAEEIINSR
jgi:bifunctional UDP-N-acetylglucosamine pyrophosphorylase/glucosamine-1-phosphate N-acetyltransferase